MAFSMTGFGRGESSSDTHRFIVEIRSVNHRFCDISIRMPRAFSSLEDRLRQIISNKINRGKIDVFVNCEEYGEREREVYTDTGLVKAYIQAADTLKSHFSLRDDLSVSTLLRMPDIFRINDVSPDEEKIWALLGDAARTALEALVTMRAREGVKLITDISKRLRMLSDLLAHIERRAPFIINDYRERLNARIAELLDQNPPDENRIAAEVVIFAERCNIDEEIIRYKSHLSQAERCCTSEEPSGRKFDFLLQEINREVNTIASKANDLTINEKVVEMKSEAEKIREQIQNLE